MANRLIDKRGCFVGSSGMVFRDQTAADLYYLNYFETPAETENHRLAVICIAWGMAMVYVQQGTRARPEWPDWPVAAIPLAGVVVNDHGVQPPNAVAHVPVGILNTLAGSPGIHVINGQPVNGLQIPWHRRVSVHRQNHQLLHYHQPQVRPSERVPWFVPQPRPLSDDPAQAPAYWTFDTLVLGTQVSSYRRIHTLNDNNLNNDGGGNNRGGGARGRGGRGRGGRGGGRGSRGGNQ
ncbi:hypothetical protein ACG7TL_005960 [Trametes sanguinea]